jgi:hypothetical protein
MQRSPIGPIAAAIAKPIAKPRPSDHVSSKSPILPFARPRDLRLIDRAGLRQRLSWIEWHGRTHAKFARQSKEPR